LRITKVFNNSVVLGVDDQGAEHVLLGPGVGFGSRPGDTVKAELVDKTFVPSGATPPERLVRLLQEIPPEDLALAGRVLDQVQHALVPGAAEHVLLPLADHISFALRRAREGGEDLEYPLQWEVLTLYPAEVALARTALGTIEAERGVRLPEQEAAALALHFVNAQLGAGDMTRTVRITRVLTEILGVIHQDLGVRVDETSVPAARFVTHLRYLVVRQQQGRSADIPEEAMAAVLRESRPREYDCAVRIAHLLAERFGWPVDRAEVLYLALHVSRLVAEADRPGAGGPGAPGADA
jgi:beta-glucoside operon transcriptional antiterminator